MILAKAMTLKYIVHFLHVMTENFPLRKIYTPYEESFNFDVWLNETSYGSPSRNSMYGSLAFTFAVLCCRTRWSVREIVNVKVTTSNTVAMTKVALKAGGISHQSDRQASCSTSTYRSLYQNKLAGACKEIMLFSLLNKSRYTRPKHRAGESEIEIQKYSMKGGYRELEQ